MKSNLLLACFATALALAPVSLPAQSEATVSMKIDVVAWGDDTGGLSFGSGKKTFTACAFRYSEPISYSGPIVLELHKSGDGDVKKDRVPMSDEDKEHEASPLIVEETANAGNQEEPIPNQLALLREKDPTLVALIPLPANARRVTILLAPAAKGSYIGYVINDDPGKLPIGKLRVHNLSPHRIAMRFNGAGQQEMAARGTLLVDAPQGHVIYQLAYQTPEEWKIQENNILPVRPNEQTQLIVLKSTNQFFLSSDGASGGFLQIVTLRRGNQPE